MIYVISKSTFGSYNVRDIQCNANWDCCPYSEYALIPDNLVDGILETKGYCDITLNSDGTAVASYTARAIPSVPKECCIEVGTATSPKVATGSVIAVDDSIYAPLHGLTLYGKTTQNGTPTPASPVELVSAGSGGTINVRITDETESNVQTVTAQTPGGLNSIGEVKDEIDFAKGVLVQRIGIAVFDGSDDENWTVYTTKSGSKRFLMQILDSKPVQPDNVSHLLNNQFSVVSADSIYANDAIGCAINQNSSLIVHTPQIQTLDALKAHLANRPMTVAYELATPIETPLSAEELAQYSTLHTNKPNTTAYNDADANMSVSYFIYNAAVPIEVGSGNEGKFLRVVNGVAAWVTVNSAEGGNF